MVRLAVKMMLWLASASLADCAAPAVCGSRAWSGAGAAAGAPLARAPVWFDELGELPEQPASSRAPPDISPAQVSAVVRSAFPGRLPLGSRSGPRGARARAMVFMPLG